MKPLYIKNTILSFGTCSPDLREQYLHCLNPLYHFICVLFKLFKYHQKLGSVMPMATNYELFCQQDVI